MLTAGMKRLLITGTDRALAFGRDERFELVFVEAANASEVVYRACSERVKNLDFIGAFALVDGVASCECVDSLAAVTAMIPAAVAYCRCIAEKSEPAPKEDDGADWLERLYQLPDMRTEVGPA